VEEDDISPLTRTNWSELTRSLGGWPETGAGGEEAREPAWANPRHAPTRRYEKLPYGIHYDQEDDECRNVVLGELQPATNNGSGLQLLIASPLEELGTCIFFHKQLSPFGRTDKVVTVVDCKLFCGWGF